MSFQDLDFKTDNARRARSGNPLKMRAGFPLNWLAKILMATGLMAAGVVALLGFSISNWPPAAEAADSTPKSERLHYSLPLPAPELALPQVIVEAVPTADPADWESVIIKSGDTLASIFSKKGISSTTTHKIATLNDQTRKLRYIQPGDEIKLLLDNERGLRQMQYIPDITRTLLIQRTEDKSYTSKVINYELDAYPVYREGVIESSLFEAAANANIPEDVIMDLAAIFGWDIDFSLDIRSGDRFGIVYEELYKDDVKIRNGRILSANFINDGKTYKAAFTLIPAATAITSPLTAKACAKPFCAAR